MIPTHATQLSIYIHLSRVSPQETLDALTPARDTADRTRSVSRPSRPKPLQLGTKTPTQASQAPSVSASAQSSLATCPKYANTLPLFLPKLHAPKSAVFEFVDSSVDLNGESGVVGRLSAAANGGLKADIQGKFIRADIFNRGDSNVSLLRALSHDSPITHVILLSVLQTLNS